MVAAVVHQQLQANVADTARAVHGIVAGCEAINYAHHLAQPGYELQICARVVRGLCHTKIVGTSVVYFVTQRSMKLSHSPMHPTPICLPTTAYQPREYIYLVSCDQRFDVLAHHDAADVVQHSCRTWGVRVGHVTTLQRQFAENVVQRPGGTDWADFGLLSSHA